jgi:hypothetical protein
LHFGPFKWKEYILTTKLERPEEGAYPKPPMPAQAPRMQKDSEGEKIHEILDRMIEKKELISLL